jgi:hypothetical protein
MDIPSLGGTKEGSGQTASELQSCDVTKIGQESR